MMVNQNDINPTENDASSSYNGMAMISAVLAVCALVNVDNWYPSNNRAVGAGGVAALSVIVMYSGYHLWNVSQRSRAQTTLDHDGAFLNNHPQEVVNPMHQCSIHLEN